MSTSTLTAASADRKARLAQLKSLKRKQPSDTPTEEDSLATSPRPSKSPRGTPDPEDPSSTSHLLSGRNYDPLTRGPKLGFEINPASQSSTATLEARAKELSDAAKAAQEEEKAAQNEGREAPLDLFKLQPKKPNWDLKRELERRLEGVNVRTDNAIARLVRERVEGQKKKTEVKPNGKIEGEADDEGRSMGMEGSTLVEATKEREREDEEEARREKILEDELEVP
ncbi:Pre-mRNA-splicing factor cwf18 [Sphaceloma murrayae]|uniref:Pre-mRNA-splicing factor cwf18 n=1 Tax=Sphaceloma murrayae TaxID=2082308 RepID=A0A2K1QFY3_9PEZI|nr:Pre-mRNA-splicing factor cwf18 [Sphaceloma murrayae]